MSNSTVHISVMLKEVMASVAEVFETTSSFLFLDGTLGGAGHSHAILSAYPNSRLLACDQDSEAIERARMVLEPFEDRAVLVNANFSNVSRVLSSLSEKDLAALGICDSSDFAFDFILLDLGLSSDQLDSLERGFSFQEGSSLDMRMDLSKTLTASEVVNTYTNSQLAAVFKRGGVGHSSGFISQEIIKNRPITSAGQLASICEKISRISARKSKRKSEGKKSHPATVPFQALRIEVNDELRVIDAFLESIPEILAHDGRLAVISFHSLEDKIVASKMRAWSRLDPEQYKLPIATEVEFGSLLTKKALMASSEESERNPRSRSARLRIFQRRSA